MSILASGNAAVPATPVWVPDLGDGRYRNPVLHADYSDPDAVRVGDDYWLTASSFSCAPGLPVLHSRDLVNWALVNYALPRLVPEAHFSVPRHGCGVWAPALRYHDGRFWIFYPDPDFGLYVITAQDPAGAWSAPVLVRAGKGLIDPCPLWDDDGRLYLIHGWAKSRADINNILTLLRLSPDGLRVEEDLGVIIDGDKVPMPGFRTLEGPKFYKRDGWYYVFAPAGGVAEGWQSVFRAKDIRGPYEHRVVLAQGKTPINGPHQGALVDTPAGQQWFLHFQDLEAFGRIVHLQPVVWRDGWPEMGANVDAHGVGEPVLVHAKPALPVQPVCVPPTDDEFATASLGLQWQWQCNPQPGWASLLARPGYLRLPAQSWPQGDVTQVGALLLQKFPAREFGATTELDGAQLQPGDSAGLMVYGLDSAYVALRRTGSSWELGVATRVSGHVTEAFQPLAAAGARLWLRVSVSAEARCRFSFSVDGQTFVPVGGEFAAQPGRWVGAKIGLFARAGDRPDGAADYAWFRVHPLAGR